MSSIGQRIDALLKRAGLKNRNELADFLGVTRQYLSQVINGKSPAYDLWLPLCEKLGTNEGWLRYGKGDAPYETHESSATIHRMPLPFSSSAQPLDLVGVVTAGDGDLTRYEQLPNPAPWNIPQSWKIVQVFGRSAYPVIYEGQWAAIDTDRAQCPPFSAESLIDLHDNIVLVQTDDKRGFLKRFCRAPGAPGDFILASIDGGKSSPFVPPESILVVAPVVGTFFVDPGQPREKRWHNKSVTPDMPGDPA